MGTRWKRGSEHVRVRKCGGGDGVGGGWRGRTGTEDAHGGGSWRKEGVRRLWAGGGGVHRCRDPDVGGFAWVRVRAGRRRFGAQRARENSAAQPAGARAVKHSGRVAKGQARDRDAAS